MEADDILRRIKPLLRARRSSAFHRVDLHVHSPASHDYRGASDISPYEFVSAYVGRGYDLIAITDHHTGAYIDSAIEARKQIAAVEGKNITILPGVELNVSTGVHLLAIFGDGGSARIFDLLSRLELQADQHGSDKKLIDFSISEVAKIVHDRGGLLIGAHCNSTHGVIEELSGQSRLDWLRQLDALEINSRQDETKIVKTINYVTKDLGVKIPFTFGSDSHDAASDNSGMWVKMAEPSIASLRQLTFEPDLRVRRTEPKILSHGRIVGFTTTEGIYANERFRFSPNLNVLLGGRGAGKSAAIDLMRFAFEAEPRLDDDNYTAFANRIKGFLKSIGEILVAVECTDGKIYVITRSGAYKEPTTRTPTAFVDPAKVYQVADDNLIPRNLRPQDVLGIEFYGQGEAARLADRVGEQLRLIDENLDLSVSLSTIAEAEQELIEDESLVIKHKHHVEELRAEAAAIPQLEERHGRLSGSLADPIFSERNRWDQEKNWMQERQDWAKDALDLLPESIPSPTGISIDIEGSSGKSVLEKVRDASERFLESGQSDLNRLRETAIELVSDLEDYRTEWSIAFEEAEKRYRARLIELGVANLEQVAAEQREVAQKLTQLSTFIVPEIEQIETEIAALENRRVKLLKKLKIARQRVDSLRADFVEELNSRLSGSVMVSLSECDSSFYFDAVNGPLQGSGMHHREDQLTQVCDSFSPEKFVEIVRSQSVDPLMEVGVTQHSATLMLTRLHEDDLYKIERVDRPPLPSIRIKREGEASYTELSSLSVGEKCSAILSIALLSKGKPLVIDQPEDDLDHAFIVNSIVEGIRTAKSGRQIIAATHNPNIPVLGDAEMVFRVARKAGADTCQIANSGGLELPVVTKEVQSLEGGAEAFERRRKRYSAVT